MQYFSQFSAKQHSEMIISNRYKEIMPIDVMKVILSRQEHVNFTVSNSQFNFLLTLQGFILENFINLWLKADMKFTDTVDSLGIEYNNPFARNHIRVNNQKEANGRFFMEKVEIDKLCMDLLEIFFPNENFIWADFYQFTHMSVLALVRYSFEYGFIKYDDLEKMGELIFKAVVSLGKLEVAWREKLQFEKNVDPIRLERLEKKRLLLVADYMITCKEHIACIVIQMITLHYDHNFVRIFPQFVYKAFGFSSEDDESKRMYNMIRKDFPFFQKSFNNNILTVVMNYLSESSYLGPNKVMNDRSRNAIEKAFMYVSTSERDCFITSVRQVTSNDLKWFDVNLEESSKLKNKAVSFRTNLMFLLESFRSGGFDFEGNKVKPLGKAMANDKNFNIESSGHVVVGENAPMITGKGKDIYNEGKNIDQILEEYIKDIESLLNQDEDFKWSLSRQSVPILL